MSFGRPIFEIHVEGDTLILSPTSNLSELELSYFEDEYGAVIGHLGAAQVHNVVLDFHGTDYYGSTALGFFLKLWKLVQSMDGKMAFCNVSAHEQEILRLTRLDTLWPIYGTREDALQWMRPVSS
ncbi:MAG: STAS domain-containing protein [Pirellulaceae bacterium]